MAYLNDHQLYVDKVIYQHDTDNDYYIQHDHSYSSQFTFTGQVQSHYGEGTIHTRAIPSNSTTTPRLVISTNMPGQRTWGGRITIGTNSRTNSPNNAQFRHVFQQYRFVIYNDGDADFASASYLANQHNLLGGGNISHDWHHDNSTNNLAGRNDQHFHFIWNFSSWQGHEVFINIEASYRAGATWHGWWEY